MKTQPMVPCRRCGDPYPQDQYYKNHANKTGYMYICKPCHCKALRATRKARGIPKRRVVGPIEPGEEYNISRQPCPECGVAAGKWCRSPTDMVVAPHAIRVHRARAYKAEELAKQPVVQSRRERVATQRAMENMS
jgi:hypothetical protein